MEEMTNAVKPYESLEFTDDFIFWKVLTTDLDLCRELLELVLGVEIEKVELAEGQKTMQPQPDSHGIRLDVYVVDEAHSVYDIDMQTKLSEHLPKRMRYYQSVIDLNQLESGKSYSMLNRSYVIFICLADLFLLHFSQNTK